MQQNLPRVLKIDWTRFFVLKSESVIKRGLLHSGLMPVLRVQVSPWLMYSKQQMFFSISLHLIILIHIPNRNKMTKEFHVCEVAVELLSSPPLLLLAVPFISVRYQTQTRFDYLCLFVRFAVC